MRWSDASLRRPVFAASSQRLVLTIRTSLWREAKEKAAVDSANSRIKSIASLNLVGSLRMYSSSMRASLDPEALATKFATGSRSVASCGSPPNPQRSHFSAAPFFEMDSSAEVPWGHGRGKRYPPAPADRSASHRPWFVPRVARRASYWHAPAYPAGPSDRCDNQPAARPHRCRGRHHLRTHVKPQFGRIT